MAGKEQSPYKSLGHGGGSEAAWSMVQPICFPSDMGTKNKGHSI
jgi:hypothetical protein